MIIKRGSNPPFWRRFLQGWACMFQPMPLPRYSMNYRFIDQALREDWRMVGDDIRKMAEKANGEDGENSAQ
jgi:hypothetical protein